MGQVTGTVPRRMLAHLPRGEPLAPEVWRVRHWFLVVVLLAHVPLVVAVAERGPLGTLGAVGPLLVSLTIAALAPWRATAAAAVAVGLTWSAATTVVGLDGSGLAYAHVALVVVACGLYQSWVPLLLAVVGGLVVVGVGGLIDAALVHGAWGAEAPLAAAGAASALVVAAAVLALAWWSAAEHEQRAARASAAHVARRERQVADRLAAVEALKSQLIAIVAHEFRTPLTSITGFARTLSARQGQLDEEAVQACLDGIDHHARRLTRLVHNIIAASGELAIDHTAVTDLGAIAEEVAHDAMATHGRGVQLRVQVPARLEAAIDPTAARRVVANLCDNAVKFAPRGTRVEIIGSLGPDWSALEITNEVAGSASVDLDALFEPFVQADSSDTRPVEGLGLGLHVARLMARAHDGDLVARRCGDRLLLRLSLPLPGRLRHRDGEDRITVLDGEAMSD